MDPNLAVLLLLAAAAAAFGVVVALFSSKQVRERGLFSRTRLYWRSFTCTWSDTAYGHLAAEPRAPGGKAEALSLD